MFETGYPLIDNIPPRRIKYDESQHEREAPIKPGGVICEVKVGIIVKCKVGTIIKEINEL